MIAENCELSNQIEKLKLVLQQALLRFEKLDERSGHPNNKTIRNQIKDVLKSQS
jgi:hypothetical protein